MKRLKLAVLDVAIAGENALKRVAEAAEVVNKPQKEWEYVCPTTGSIAERRGPQPFFRRPPKLVKCRVEGDGLSHEHYAERRA